MNVAMSRAEIDLLSALLRRTSTYLEFGTGGSTVLASRLVAKRITSIDSSQDWLDRCKTACDAAGGSAVIDFVFVDIGPIRDWGYPADPSTAARWPGYYENAWQVPQALDADLCLVDGRFRMASALTTLLRCKPDTLIAVHDFADRLWYHGLRDHAREVAIAENLSVFLPDPTVSRQRIAEELARHRFDPR